MIIFLLILHTTLLLFGGYFLSSEFVLYPYLTSHGFIPYLNLIDQHLPVIFFGPFSLPYWVVSNRALLLSLFVSLALLTDLFFYLSLKKQKAQHPLFFTFSFIILSWYFGGNFFWLTTFITFFLAIFFYLSSFPHSFVKFLAGICLSLLVMIKPTLLPAGILLLLYFSSLSLYTFLGLFLPLITTFLYLLRLNLLIPFFDLIVEFNSHYYVPLAQKLPNLRQLILSFFAFVPFLLVLATSKKLIPLIIPLLFLSLCYPRFEFLHLGPFILVLLYFSSQNKLNHDLLILLVLTTSIFMVLTLMKLKNYRYGDFYLNPQIKNISQTIKSLPGDHILVLGGSELIYPLSGKVPPGYYLPPLPWYFADSAYKEQLLDSLKKSKAPILYDPGAIVDDQPITQYAGFLIEYLEDNYHRERIENLYLYTPN